MWTYVWTSLPLWTLIYKNATALLSFAGIMESETVRSLFHVRSKNCLTCLSKKNLHVIFLVRILRQWKQNGDCQIISTVSNLIWLELKKEKNFGVTVGFPKTAYYIHIINILILKYSYILHLLGTYFTNFHISSVLPTKHICSAVEYGNAKHLAASKIVIVFTSRLRHG